MYRRRGNRGLGGSETTNPPRGDIQPNRPEGSSEKKDITELVSVEGFFDFLRSLLCDPQVVNHSAFLQLLNQAISKNNPQKRPFIVEQSVFESVLQSYTTSLLPNPYVEIPPTELKKAIHVLISGLVNQGYVAITQNNNEYQITFGCVKRLSKDGQARK